MPIQKGMTFPGIPSLALDSYINKSLTFLPLQLNVQILLESQ